MEGSVDGRLAQRAADLIGNVVADVIVRMASTGQIDGDSAIQILKEVEARLEEVGRRLMSEEAAQAHPRRCFSIN